VTNVRARRVSGIRSSLRGPAVPMPPGLQDLGVVSEINVTPMIDVMIVLLIIFMVVTPVITNYAVRLPEAAFVSPERDDDVVELGIDQSGAYWVGGERIEGAELETYLTRLFASRPGDHLLYLRADQEIGYDLVLDAVDAARAAGVRRIGAIADPRSAAPAATSSRQGEQPWR
jgi:biopolymer transport protein ExbD/biopolymer transport protein TolR